MLIRFIAGLLLVLASVTELSAQTVPEEGSSFLDFGVPCKDPHEELEGPVLLRGNKSAPKSNPATPLAQAPYPALSRQMGEEGTAVLRLLISDAGAVSQAHVIKSTGSPRLDSAALEVTRGWKLVPGKVDGQPRCMWGKFAVTFVLTDYSNEELAAVSVPKEARTLADLIVGMEEMRGALFKSDTISETERRILDLAAEAAANSPVWIGAYDRISRILAIEFTPGELAELSEFFSSPVASKWRTVSFKMNATLQVEQRLVSETLFCALAGVTDGMRQDASRAAPATTQITEAQASAITKYVGDVIPYCQCRHKLRSSSPVATRTGGLQQCGPPPKLEEL